MSRETFVRLARRTLVVAGTVAVIGVAVGTVQVAADWRAASAPLDAAPVGMSSIEADFAAQQTRAGDLANQIDGVAEQISGLQSAIITASGGVTTDTASATDLQKQLAAAKAKLTTLQKQLKAAQSRLEALNRAAARQAAANRASRVSSTTTSSSSSSSSRGGDDGGHEGGGEHGDD